MVTNYTDICDIVDLRHLSMYGRCVDPDLLEAKIDTWALSHEVAYGKTLTYLKTTSRHTWLMSFACVAK